MYAVWMKIDETFPWIELKGEYKTKKEARKEAKKFLKNFKINIVEIPERKKAKTK